MGAASRRGTGRTGGLVTIDLLKGVCASWVVMLHTFAGGGSLNRLLLMPFYAQLTIPFFMAATGFVYAASYARAGGAGGWYGAWNVLRKLARVALPFAPALVLELVVWGAPGSWARWLASGGYQMPGSYYPILMVELLVLFPAVPWACGRFMDGRWDRPYGWLPGLLAVFGLHCLYELATWALDLPASVYRLLVLRYGIFLYGGALIYGYRERGGVPWREFLVLVPFGMAYIALIGYAGWRPQVLFRYDTWFRSAAPTAFWVLPVFACLLAHEGAVRSWLRGRADSLQRAACGLLSRVGRASYHVFVVQMLWFGMVYPHLPTASWRALAWFPVSLVVCVSLGLSYWRLERALRARMTARRARLAG